MELPHFDVLHRKAGAQRHADAIAGVHQRVGSARVDAPGTTSGQHRRPGGHIDHIAGLDLDGNDPGHGAVLVLHQINGEPFVQKGGAAFDVGLVEGVQQRMTGAVGGGAGAGRLPTLAVVLRLAAERALIDAA